MKSLRNRRHRWIACWLSVAGALLFIWLMLPTSAAGAELRIRVCGLESREGNLRIAVFTRDHAKEFTDPTSDAFAIGVTIRLADIQDIATLRIAVPIVTQGDFAIRVTHDENANGVLDFTELAGTPKEPYGYSRNARARFSPVSFEEAAIAPDQISMGIDVRLVRWSLIGEDKSPCPP
jgi:uncharacterized protein (DUF2141 family)